MKDELEDIQQLRDQGFPERQHEIRKQYPLDVTVTPVTMTEVEYERGELQIVVADENTPQTITTGYGVEVGITDDTTVRSVTRNSQTKICSGRFRMG